MYNTNMDGHKTSKKFYRNLIFIIGIVATFAYRIIVILNHYSQLWVEIAWFIGTIGFIWYFAHRFRIENKRDKLIEERNLTEKMRNKEVSQQDRDVIVYILKSLETSKAKWNYIFIFAFSLLALIYAIVVDINKLLK